MTRNGAKNQIASFTLKGFAGWDAQRTTSLYRKWRFFSMYVLDNVEIRQNLFYVHSHITCAPIKSQMRALKWTLNGTSPEERRHTNSSKSGSSSVKWYVTSSFRVEIWRTLCASYDSLRCKKSDRIHHFEEVGGLICTADNNFIQGMMHLVDVRARQRWNSANSFMFIHTSPVHQ